MLTLAVPKEMEKEDRAKQMAELYMGGQTLEQVGQQFGITRERVRQIIRPLGVSRYAGGASLTAKKRRAKTNYLKNKRSMEKHGLEWDSYKNLPLKIRRAFTRQKTNAQKRGIDWSLTLSEWWEIWDQSGKWESRGRGHGYCMARKGDDGPYSRDNVYICTCAQNASDQYRWKPYGSEKRKFPLNKPPKTITHNGRTQTIKEWAEEMGLMTNTLAARLYIGWPISRALSEPCHNNNKHKARLARGKLKA